MRGKDVENKSSEKTVIDAPWMETEKKDHRNLGSQCLPLHVLHTYGVHHTHAPCERRTYRARTRVSFACECVQHGVCADGAPRVHTHGHIDDGQPREEEKSAEKKEKRVAVAQTTFIAVQ